MVVGQDLKPNTRARLKQAKDKLHGNTFQMLTHFQKQLFYIIKRQFYAKFNSKKVLQIVLINFIT